MAAEKLFIGASGSAAQAGVRPGGLTDIRRDSTNTLRIIGVWSGSYEAYLGTLTVNWRFGAYSGLFVPSIGDLEVDTSVDRMVYQFRPSLKSRFRRDWSWDAWTLTIPDFGVADVEVGITAPRESLLFLGCAILHGGKVVRRAGPKIDAVSCHYTRW